jgi:hypothetical protein
MLSDSHFEIEKPRELARYRERPAGAWDRHCVRRDRVCGRLVQDLEASLAPRGAEAGRVMPVEKDAAGQRSILAQRYRYACLVKFCALQLDRGAQ